MKKFLEKLKEILLKILNSNVFKTVISVMIDVLGIIAVYDGMYKLIHGNMNWTALIWVFMIVLGVVIIKNNDISSKMIIFLLMKRKKRFLMMHLVNIFLFMIMSILLM